MARPRIGAKGHFFEQQGTRRQHQPAAEGQQQEGGEGRPGDQIEDDQAGHHGIAEQFHQRPKALDQQHGGAGQPTHSAGFRMEEQHPVGPQTFEQAALPAHALTAQHRQRFGRLGPDHRLGHEGDAVGPSGEAMETVQTHRQLHVLADRVDRVAADPDQRGAAEHAESARDDQQRIHRRPTDSAVVEAAQVLEDLDAGQPVRRHIDALEVAAGNVATVGDAHRATAGHRQRVFDEGPHHALQAVALEHRVGVDDTNQSVARCIDGRVDSVRAATVVLVDHQQLRMMRAAVDAAHCLHRQRAAVGLLERLQTELALQDFDGSILRAVIDHDDLEVGIVDLQHRAHRLGDRCLFVVGRDADRDAGLEPGCVGRQRRQGTQRAVAQHRAQGDQVEQQVDQVDADEVGQEQPSQHLRPQRQRRHAASACATRLRSASTWSRMSRA